jgi:hypothetical protein
MPVCRLLQQKALSTLSALFFAMLAVFLLTAAGGAAAAGPASRPELQDIRVGYTPGRTRFAFDTPAPASYRLSRLEQPQRLIVDVGVVDPGLQLPRMSLQGTPIVSVSSEPREDGGARYIFELSRYAATRVFALPPNDTHMHRVVVDIDNAEVDLPVVALVASAAEVVSSSRLWRKKEEGGGKPGSAPAVNDDYDEVVAEEYEDEEYEDDADGISSADDLFGMDEEEEDGEEDGDISSADDLFGVEEETSGSGEASGFDRVDGFIQFESAYTYASPTHLSKARTILELGTDGRINDNISWKISGRAYYDLVFDLDNFYSDRVEDNREYDADVHETYVDISAGDLELRLGRQHIIWGEMVGLFFADVVSAKDTRQFVNQDFDLIRIPQWAAQAEYYMGDYHAEVIWIPVMTYNEIGVPGDDFYPLGTKPPENIKLVIKNPDEPSNDLDNSAYGLRVSALKVGWDISGFYYRSVDAEPTYFNEVIVDPEPTLLFTPKHKKIHQFGATLAKDFGGFLLKSEAVFTKDRYFAADVPVDRGVVQQDFLDYVVGLEHTTPDNTLLNFQIYQRWFPDHDSHILFDEFETGVSLFGQVEVNDKLDVELLLISQLNRTDWMVRPRVTWTFASNWFLQFGADIMGGKDEGVFARFDDSDRIYTNVRYTF